MSESSRPIREGDELWLGLIGPIRVSDEVTPERERWNEAGRIAQAAHSLVDLCRLVAEHPDHRVRYQAIPRLRARFPDDQRTFDVLAAASREPHPAVRRAAIDSLQWLARPEAADVIAERLRDEDFDVRLSAGYTLSFLGDDRAPSDPEAEALEGFADTEGG